MKAVGYKTAGALDRPDSLIDLEIDKPTATGRDLLVRIQAVSVNPVDYKIRQSRPPEGDTPVILGWDAVGEVVATGKDATMFKSGDKVWYAGAIDRSGTNAEYHLVDERIVGNRHRSVTAADAASLPLTALTAYEMLFDRLRVGDAVPGAANAVVIIGGSGGVGSIAIQLLRAKTDMTVIATASRPETQGWVKDLGAHYVINHTEPLAPQIEALGTGQPGYVFSTTHTHEYIEQIAEFIAPQGRFGLIDDPETLNIMPLKTKAISTHWELMFTRSLFETADITRQHDILNEVADLLDAGKIKSTATEVLGKIDAATLKRAHATLESNKAKGKLVLEGF
ncbi:zinc-binding alcohol dehydrogenase family protein [Sulfitobacter sp. F26169L]|uniref:zinc-binding alcohol dehydrogenase family protein n=1 Tax=Sulfitobacter sp. F26169L TaxID=2996015 RepID=UPI0022609B30|nr:zinc-binding alcohol dehydrogenase family protein [Sulfitobacter sp. F26169L]MCX7567674.1 zinc-binding alcohol dehydrogenase family protein [Sulfitobacter sp. F26169L]